MPTLEFLRNFSNITKKDVLLAGGKGASLGEMANAGIHVPLGYVILAPAFDRFIKEACIKEEIDAALHKVNHEDIASVDEASERIKAMIISHEMPRDLATGILAHFKKLGSKYVAVRSSATAEDSSSAAWAGQLETYLNTTEKTLLDNVKRCWASLFTPRAIFYRFEKNLHTSFISVAVVVQKMVESEIAGIAFSVHPVTKDRNQLIIEAGYGLGEAVVSGEITPDSYIVEKKDWMLLDVHIAEQEKALYRKASGGNEWKELPASHKEKQKLTGKEIIELAKLIVKIEKHYSFPVDVEWAMKKGKFYITQSRPITTL